MGFLDLIIGLPGRVTRTPSARVRCNWNYCLGAIFTGYVLSAFH